MNSHEKLLKHNREIWDASEAAPEGKTVYLNKVVEGTTLTLGELMMFLGKAAAIDQALSSIPTPKRTYGGK